MRKLLNFKIVLAFVSVVVIVCIASVQATSGQTSSGSSQGENFNPFDSECHLRPLPTNSHNYLDTLILPLPYQYGQNYYNVFSNDGKISGNASARATWVTNIVIPSRARHRSPCHTGS